MHIHEDQFCDLIGHGGQPDWSVLPRVLLITLFKADVMSLSHRPSSDYLDFQIWWKLA